VKVIEPEEFINKTGYTSPHTIHCGLDGVYGSALGSASGEGPGGIFRMDANTFELNCQPNQRIESQTDEESGDAVTDNGER
jgi:56kDa selenium binding protein (SBP56)